MIHFPKEQLSEIVLDLLEDFDITLTEEQKNRVDETIHNLEGRPNILVFPYKTWLSFLENGVDFITFTKGELDRYDRNSGLISKKNGVRFFVEL